jgi:hypothetical protein
MSERRLLVKVEAKRYRSARKKEKGRILDELVAASGYNRWYAVGPLRGHGNVIKVGPWRSRKLTHLCSPKLTR